ncbi:unnamed protein product [Camellia sinensis]
MRDTMAKTKLYKAEESSEEVKPETTIEEDEEEEENIHVKKIETFSEHPDKIAPLVGYFPSGFDPLKEESSTQEQPKVRVFRHENRTKRLQLVVSPNGSQVNFVGTNYSGEATAPQLCNYALGVLDKESQTLKIVPIASNKICRLEPIVAGSDSYEKEPSKEELRAEERADKIRELKRMYSTAKSVKQDKKSAFWRRERTPWVAELMAFMAKNRSISYCKVVEVIAETTAPLTPVGELLVKIPSQRVEIKPLKNLQFLLGYYQESDTAGGPQSSKSVVSEPPLSAPVEKEPAIEKAVAASPLSPYIVYEDLKPPTSPTPTPSTSAGATQASHVEGISSALKIAPSSTQINISESPSTVTEKEAVQTEVKKKTPLSPYANYEDWKPPTSPSPTPSGPKDITLSASTPAKVVSQVTSGNDVAKIPKSSAAEGDSKEYVDLRPPTSPSPNAPTGSLLPPSSSNGGSQMATVLVNNTAQALPNEQHPAGPKPRYEDLKPPTSPMPSPRKL